MTAGRAGVGDGTLLGAGGIHSHRGVAVTQSAALGSATDRAGLGGIAVSVGPGVAQSSNLVGHGCSAADAVGSGISTLGAGGIDDFLTGSIAGVPAIVSSAVLEDSAGLSTGGLQVGAVAVLQPCGSDVHNIVSGTGAVQAVSHFLDTGTVVHGDLTGLLGGDDGCAAANGNIFIIDSDGGIQEAIGNDLTVDIDDDILQVTGGTLIATGGGRIRSCNERLIAEDEIAPVILIENIDIVAAGAVGGQVVDFAVSQGLRSDMQGCTLVHVDFYTGLQSNILSQADGAGMGLNGDIAVQVQNIVSRVEGSSTDDPFQNGCVTGVGHVDDDALNGGITVQVHDQAVGGGIIILHHIAVLRLEHAVGTNKLHGRSGDAVSSAQSGNAHSSEHVFSGTGVDGQGHLDVLNIELRNEEGLDVVVGGVAIAISILILFGIHEGGQFGAAGEVTGLHGLVDLGTGVGGDGTVAVDVTPDVQI